MHGARPRPAAESARRASGPQGHLRQDAGRGPGQWVCSPLCYDERQGGSHQVAQSQAEIRERADSSIGRGPGRRGHQLAPAAAAEAVVQGARQARRLPRDHA